MPVHPNNLALLYSTVTQVKGAHLQEIGVRPTTSEPRACASISCAGLSYLSAGSLPYELFMWLLPRCGRAADDLFIGHGIGGALGQEDKHAGLTIDVKALSSGEGVRGI